MKTGNKTKCVARGSLRGMVRRIVRRGDDRQINHRADFKHCPSCDHAMDNEQWDKHAKTLILEPGCYKAGCVSVVAECPKCFEPSWIHESMSGFKWNDKWPEDWKAAVKKHEESVKLEALRQWGADICHNCRHLTSGTVEYHAWRHCIIGSGSVRKECPKFAALDSPDDKAVPNKKV